MHLYKERIFINGKLLKYPLWLKEINNASIFFLNFPLLSF